jgi:galactokinase
MTESTRGYPLIDRAAALFADHFDRSPTVAGIAPGRVNLIGEHTDYNDGFVLPLALERRTIMVAGPNHSQRCRVVAGDLDQEMTTFLLDDSLAPGKAAWANYVKGVVAMFRRNGQPVPAFDAVVVSDVPLGGGLSSSAALEVATASAIEQLTGVMIDPVHKALWSQAAEHEFANMPCGIMDQFISVMGRAGHAMLIDCRSHQTRQVRLDDPAVAVLVINSNVKHELTGSEYPTRRKQCEQATQVLSRMFDDITALRDATMEQLDAAKDRLDPTVFQRARHVISENDRTTRAADALDRGDYGQAGRLMNESHRFLRDDYQVSCPELDTLAEAAWQCEGVFGSRMTGGGFGGCTVSLIDSTRRDAIVEQITSAYQQAHNRQATAFITRPGEGAQGVRLTARGQ